jgi:hypothetical protein
MSQRYAFIAEWLDPNSGVLWRYQLFYYKDTNELEMVSGEMRAWCVVATSGRKYMECWHRQLQQ